MTSAGTYTMPWTNRRASPVFARQVVATAHERREPSSIRPVLAHSRCRTGGHSRYGVGVESLSVRACDHSDGPTGTRQTVGSPELRRVHGGGGGRFRCDALHVSAPRPVILNF